MRYDFKLAKSPRELQGYYDLRQSIFCEEQGLFEGNDEDPIDAIAYPIVAIDTEAPVDQQVVGVVRIYEEKSRLWYGGRLGVHRDFRRVGRIGKGLIQKAVTTANTWGCDRFLATVQLQNVRLKNGFANIRVTGTCYSRLILFFLQKNGLQAKAG